MIALTSHEQVVSASIQAVKDGAGSHSPSLYTLSHQFPDINIKIDACFLSNPYASRLFLDFFHDDFKDSRTLEDLIQYYPSQNGIIAQLVAGYLGISAQNIFMGNGATEVIQAVIHNFVERKMLVNIPTFSSYYEFAKEDIDVAYYQLLKENDFTLDIDHYLRVVAKEKPDTVILINPNNPDGSYISYPELEDLLGQLTHIKNVVIDESFIHFVNEADDQVPSTVKLLNKYDNLIVIKSMSKDFGIAGIRAGYGVMSAAKVEYLLNNGYLWNLSGFSEYFFRVFVRDDFQKQYKYARINYVQLTQAFIQSLAQIREIKVYPSQSNFALLELLDGSTSFDFFNKLLLTQGIYTRNCADKMGLDGEFIRVASRTETENKTIINAIRNLFSTTENGSHSFENDLTNSPQHHTQNATIRV